MLQGNRQDNIASIGNDLLRAISVCEERVRVSRQNSERFIELSKKKEEVDKLLDMTRTTANHMNRMYKNSKTFLENKKTASNEVLEASIHAVSTVVRDADMSSCTIHNENGKTTILSSRGHSINKREGGGAMTTMGLLMKYACIKACPSKIQIMFLDEALTALSTDSSVNMKGLIEVFSKDIGIVGIEQRDTVYGELAQKRYRVRKANGVSTVSEEEVLPSNG